MIHINSFFSTLHWMRTYHHLYYFNIKRLPIFWDIPFEKNSMDYYKYFIKIVNKLPTNHRNLMINYHSNWLTSKPKCRMIIVLTKKVNHNMGKRRKQQKQKTIIKTWNNLIKFWIKELNWNETNKLTLMMQLQPYIRMYVEGNGPRRDQLIAKPS